MAATNPHQEPHGMTEHKNTYEGFIQGSVALSLICGFILAALVAFRFMDNWNVFTGFAGIILGAIATLIGWRTGGNWIPPGVLLVLFGLFVAISV
jgi:predicted Abi (CAAX) family protease